MAWKKATIQLDNGAWADAQVPESCLQVEARIFLLSMQTGSFIDWRKATQHGQIRLMERKFMCRIRIRALSCFGRRIQRS